MTTTPPPKISPTATTTRTTPTTTTITHPPPSLPSSPISKRPKTDNGNGNGPSSITIPTTTTTTTETSAINSNSNNIMAETISSSSTGQQQQQQQQQQSPPLLIKKMSDKARLPTRGSAFAAGYDLYSAGDLKIPARGKGMVDTDISIAVPMGTYGRVAPRSGLASKHFIDVGAGVIDADYRGMVKVLLFNHSEVDFDVKEGDRIAQLIIERIYTPDVVEVKELDESVRGAGGFGSTG